MNQVEQLIEELLGLPKCEDCNKGKVVPALFERKKLYALVQAVRDEEFKKHEQRINCGSVGSARLSYCASCPIIGTRYCP